MTEIIVEKEIKKVFEREICVVRVTGSVDSNNFSSFKDQLSPLAEDPYPSIIINLSKVEYLNSAGFGLLATLFRRTSRKGSCLVLTELSPKVEHIFNLMGFNQMMITYTTEAEALEEIA